MITEERLESILRNCEITNNEHKNILRKKLQQEAITLSLNELENVAGGASIEEPTENPLAMPFELIDKNFLSK